VEALGRPVVVKGFAVLALAAVLVVGACGGDDDDGTEAEGDTTDTTAQDETDDNGAQAGTGGDADQSEAPDGNYPDQVRRNFLNACAAQPGATPAQCECTFDEISRTVPVEEFVAYDQAARQDPATPPPSWVEAAVTACS
jgi:hypothetical protein